MAQLNHKNEMAADGLRKFWQGRREHYHNEGLLAVDAQCPYPRTSFAAIHWRLGWAAKEGTGL